MKTKIIIALCNRTYVAFLLEKKRQLKKTCQYFDSTRVDRAGFEPAASALRRRRSYQTDLPARFALASAIEPKLEVKDFGTLYLLS
jgi:hypothetical protein